MTHRREPVRIRWWIFLYLCGFALLSYLQRTGVSVAADAMMPALHLTHLQIGILQGTFPLTYLLFQVPGATFGQRFGARATYAGVGIIGMLALAGIPLAPLLFTGTALFVALVLAQGLLGASQGPVFPLVAAVGQVWFPENRWSFVNGAISTGMNLGGMLAPPLVVFLQTGFGWQGALLWLAAPGLVLTLAWWFYARNTPAEHPDVTAAELQELPPPPPPPPPLTLQRLWAIACDRDVIRLAVSYLCMNYAFYLLSSWSFLYLREVRHLDGLESGLAGALPWIGAAAGAGLGGHFGDQFTTRFGPRWGLRLIPLITLPTAGLLLLATIHIATTSLAVLTLTVAFCAVELNEGPYWASCMRIARSDTGAATGFLNTFGNMAGIIAGPLVGWLSGRGGWNAAFITGTGFAIVAGLLWLAVDPGREPAPADAT
jgi:ACS family glucarate transporter-like MFS transporter